ncbi:ABC transporter ATP-binding protein [Amphibacillus sp. Q70]|uniref:ABC transporter ATP-binding protein n=1 Tax=Amphibacillus sp. Q70 TaxID=3453416 RepID=UPI003F8477B3
MIDVHHLTFSYRKEAPVIKGLNFSVQKGEIFGFLGPNGSGKSTTQKILIGILKGYRGDVQLMGNPPGVPSKEFQKNIGVLFEFPYLYANLSAIDNLKYFASFYPKNQLSDIEEVLGMLQFKKEYLKKPVSSYSKGMRQRVNMARALIHNPKILFLDEPTSGLDPSGTVLFREIIQRERQKGTTVFLTTHNMMDADLLCDKVALISDGEIKVWDRPKNLKEKNSERLTEITYMLGGKRLRKTIGVDEIEAGILFPHDEIVSIHSKEPTLEEIFIRYTGKELTS